MALSSGTRLGPYEVVSALGAGGMGEVYRARDTRLNRTVAIKVLPSQFSQNAEMLHRFEREARAISSLSHPHICTVHDIGHQSGADYLVMEYLEGETLQQRLEKGALQTEQVLRYAIEIADALDKAHRQGIVHRDLKPGNIMLTKSGAKLLDFGLSKLQAQVAPVAGALTEITAGDRKLTEKGTIVGTFQYMAPEQLEGKEADARTDIFAFGSVVHEMATGKPAFSGKSKASLIAAILERDPPPISSLQPMVPPALDRVVKRCLAKDPDERWQTANDLTNELKWIAEGGSQAGVSVPVALRRKFWQRLAWGAATVFLLSTLALAGFVWRQSTRLRPAPPVVRFTLPASEPLAVIRGPALAFAPDGRRIAYVVLRNETTQLYVRELASFEGKLLEGTEGAAEPFFSPDGEWLGFIADGKLKKVSVTGGPAMVLCEAPEGNGATWLPDGTIVFNADWREGLRRVSAAGGTPEVLTRPDLRRGEAYHWWPDVLPGGEAILFTNQKGPGRDEASVAVLSLRSGEWRTVVDKASNPHYLPSGHIVYERSGGLLAMPFDTEKLAVSGPSLPVLQGALFDSQFQAAQIAVSRNGSLAYLPGTMTRLENTLVTVDRSGHERPITDLRRAYEDLTLSPDGRFLALTVIGELYNVWLYDLGSGTLSRVTFEGDNRDPIWTADSKRIIYVSFRNGRHGIFWKPITGPGLEEELVGLESQPFPYSTSRDGRWLSYGLGPPAATAGVYLLPLQGDRKPRPIVLEPFAQGGAISPDGKWMAYESRESGRSEVYVRPLSSGSGKWQVSTEGGIRPLWSTDGRELFFRTGSIRSTATLMSVAVQTEPEFIAGPPRPLFRFRYAQAGHSYSVMPDGQHFICIKESEHHTGPTQLNVILNWTAELKK